MESSIKSNSLKNEEIRSAVYELLNRGFENPENVSGVFLMAIFDDENVLNDPVHLQLMAGSSLRVELGDVTKPDAKASMPLGSLKRILNESQWLDFRDPSLMSTIALEGNRDLVNFFARMILHPNEEMRQRLEYWDDKDEAIFSASEFERVKRPTEHYILQALADCRPFIITDVPVNRPHTDWSLDYLNKIYSNTPLRVRAKNEQETLGEFLLRMDEANSFTGKITDGHTKAYTEGCALPEAMRAEFVPAYFTLHDYIEPQIWLGNVPVNVPASSLHRDPMDGFLYQIMGRKKMVMYAPNQAKYLYPLKAYNNYQPCWVEPMDPNYDRYPEFKKAKPVEVILNPGELLIQPAGWFHAVYCLDSPTFSVSHFYRM